MRGGDSADCMIVNIHRVDSHIGHWMSSPLRFFAFPTETAEVDILSRMSQLHLDLNALLGDDGLPARHSFAPSTKSF